MFKRTSHIVSRPEDDSQKAHLAPVPPRKEILPAITTIEDVLFAGIAIPLTNRVVVDRDFFLDALDQLQAELPSSLTRAEALLRDEESIRSRAEAEGKRMLARAQDQVAVMLSEKGLLREAEAARERILRDAKTEAQEITDSARRYVDDLLGKVERCTSDVLVEIRKTTSLVKARG
jgi:hypothetical protein